MNELKDILREMRGRAEDGRVDRALWRRYADRIEAAAKRDAAIHVMTCEANERLREHLEIALEDNKKPVGNAAAMREALEAFQRWYETVRPYVFHYAKLATVVDKMRAALAAPARNCDRFSSVKEAATAFAAEIKDKPHPCPDFTFSAWLFAPATEQKGETDGSK